MAAEVEKSNHLKLWIVFGLFIGLIVGLIIYEVQVYMKAKQQRENIEETRRKVSKSIQFGTVDTESEQSEEGQDSSKN